MLQIYSDHGINVNVASHRCSRLFKVGCQDISQPFWPLIRMGVQTWVRAFLTSGHCPTPHPF